MSGGRGRAATPTTVFEVTSLDDTNTPGTLRYAVSQLSSVALYRTIVFRVCGTIRLGARLNIPATHVRTGPLSGEILTQQQVIWTNHLHTQWKRPAKFWGTISRNIGCGQAEATSAACATSATAHCGAGCQPSSRKKHPVLDAVFLRSALCFPISRLGSRPVLAWPWVPSWPAW